MTVGSLPNTYYINWNLNVPNVSFDYRLSSYEEDLSSKRWIFVSCDYTLTNHNTVSVSRDYKLTNHNTVSVSRSGAHPCSWLEGIISQFLILEGMIFASNMRDRKFAVFIGVSFPKSEPFLLNKPFLMSHSGILEDLKHQNTTDSDFSNEIWWNFYPILLEENV